MIDFASITLVDYGVMLVLVISAIMATLRGMTRELLGLVGWIISFFMANYSSPSLGLAINDALNLGGLGDALGWGIPFATTVLICFVIAGVIAPGLTRVGLGGFDRWLGVLFGLIRGVLIVLVIFVTTIWVIEGEDQLPDNIKSSHTVPLMSQGAYHLASFLPPQYRDNIIDKLSHRPPLGSGPVAETIGDSIKAVSNGMKLLKDEESQ